MLANVKNFKTMDKTAFIKTFSATKRNKIQVVGSITIVVFNEIFHEDTGMYEYVECSANTENFDYKSVCAAYEAWKRERFNAQLSFAKQLKIAEIDAYDKSSAVNGFYLNGMLIPWSKDDPSSPNVDKRMGLRQNIADKVALGEENISIWMKGMSFTMPCAQAEMLMRSIENYAYECFNVTAAHKVAVSELTSIEEVEKYDITAGYPAQLKMEV